MRRLQPVLRLRNLQPVALDVRCLFDEQPPFLWAKVQDTLDESLPDDCGDALTELERRAGREALEALEVEPLQVHFGPLCAGRGECLQRLPGGVQFSLLLVTPLPAAQHLLTYAHVLREQLRMIWPF